MNYDSLDKFYKDQLKLVKNGLGCKNVISNLIETFGGKAIVLSSVSKKELMFKDRSNLIHREIEHYAWLDCNKNVYDPELDYFKVDLFKYLLEMDLRLDKIEINFISKIN